jgi:peptidoglycan/LPS O-acetylase OafA/YrhL
MRNPILEPFEQSNRGETRMKTALAIIVYSIMLVILSVRLYRNETENDPRFTCEPLFCVFVFGFWPMAILPSDTQTKKTILCNLVILLIGCLATFCISPSNILWIVKVTVAWVAVVALLRKILFWGDPEDKIVTG